jgi:hypothetical protein
MPGGQRAGDDPRDEEAGMPDASILICYDGSEGANRAIDAAAALLGPGRAIVLEIGRC